MPGCKFVHSFFSAFIVRKLPGATNPRSLRIGAVGGSGKGNSWKEDADMRKGPWLLLLLLGSMLANCFAQGIDVPPRFVIDKPTAGVLPRAGVDFSLRAFGEGGLIGNIDVGITDRFMFGISYGGTNVLGNDKIEWNQTPGVTARYQFYEEGQDSPALTAGFDSQGYGAYVDSVKRYVNKSPGFFVALSKSYEIFHRADGHIGVNYSLESGDGDRSPNVFVAVSTALSNSFELLAEYDFALNDDKGGENSINSGKGFLNVGARLNIRDVVYIEFFVKDMLENRRNIQNANRELKITYFQFIQ